MVQDERTALTLAADLTVAWLANPSTRAGANDVPKFLLAVHATLNELSADGGSAKGGGAASKMQEHRPAVSVRASLASRDHLISLIDGKPYRALKRHLTRLGLTPDQYRERYGLKPDYPMVAPTFSEERSAAAKGRQSGRKRQPENALAAE